MSPDEALLLLSLGSLDLVITLNLNGWIYWTFTGRLIFSWNILCSIKKIKSLNIKKKISGLGIEDKSCEGYLLSVCCKKYNNTYISVTFMTKDFKIKKRSKSTGQVLVVVKWYSI